MEVAVFAVLVRALDAAAYGMFIVAAGIAGQFTFLDLGLARALERFLPAFRTDGRSADVPRALTFVLGLHLSVGALVALGLLVFSAFGGGHLLAADDGETMADLLLIAAAFSLPLWTLRCLESALVGMGRMPASSVVLGTSSLIRGGLLLGGASSGFSIDVLLVCALGVEVAAGAVRLILLRQVLPGPLLVIDRDTVSVGRKMFGYSVWVGVQQFVIVVSNGLDRVLMSALFGPAFVPVYWIVMRLIRVVPGMIGAIGKRAIMPIAAELHGQGGDAGLEALVLRGTRVYSAFIGAVVALLVVYATPILEVLGGEVVVVWAWTAQLSLLVMLPVLTRGVLLQTSIIKTETARDSAIIGVLCALLHVTFLVLAAHFDSLGAAILSWSVAHALLSPWWVYRMAVNIGLRAARFYRAAVAGAWPAVLIVLLHVPLIDRLAVASPPQTIIMGVMSAAVTTAVVGWLGLDGDARRALLARMRRSGDAAIESVTERS